MGKPDKDGNRQTVTPHLVVKGAADAIEFYKKAFAAEETMRFPSPDGKMVMHAEIKIGGSILMLADEMPQMEYWVSPVSIKGTTVGIALDVDDADAWFDRAVKAGARVSMPMMDAFWGARYGKVTDPFGHEWELSTHKEDLSPEEVMQRAKECFSS